jgi:ketosteroid isomerase-like protein
VPHGALVEEFDERVDVARVEGLVSAPHDRGVFICSHRCPFSLLSVNARHYSAPASHVKGALEEYAEDAELDISAVFTDTPPLRGHESMRHQLDEWWETWQGLRMDSLQVLDAGRGRFVVDVRLWGKGKRSGAEVEQRFAFLYTLREADNKIVRAQLFPDAETAMEHARASRSAVQSG